MNPDPALQAKYPGDQSQIDQVKLVQQFQFGAPAVQNIEGQGVKFARKKKSKQENLSTNNLPNTSHSRISASRNTASRGVASPS